MAEDSSSKRTRASGEVLEYLLREFEQNQNPSPEQRKEISERTNMPEKAVRIWFQNRRAKLRKFERMGKSVQKLATPASYGRPNGSMASSRSNLSTSISMSHMNGGMSIPTELNENYCFVDCSSLSVGSWQRIKTGLLESKDLSSSLINLSPFTLNNVMNNVDLMVIMSKKNFEINYFFSAIANNSKILFRIFYPITSIASCSLLDNNIKKDDNELRLNLSYKPKFSVYFLNGVNANLNQWSICDDFSEGQQVSTAFYAPGGTSTPHVLVGLKKSLAFLHTFIRDNVPTQTKDFFGTSVLPEVSDAGQHSPAQMPGSMSNSDAGDYEADTTPSVDFHGFAHPGAAVDEKGPLIMSNPSDNKNGFQIQHENEWHDTPRSDDFAGRPVSPIGDFDNQSHSSSGSHTSAAQPKYSMRDSKIAESISELPEEKKHSNDYSEIFTESPDFFSTVQTPTSKIAGLQSGAQNHAGLIHSPSTHVHSFNSPGDLHQKGLHDVRDSLEEGHGESQFGGDLGGTNYAFNDPITPGGFQPNDLIIESPSLSNSAATPHDPAASQVESYINFNGDV